MTMDIIICGDVLDELKKIPDSSIDLIVCSPPYNKGGAAQGYLIDNVLYSHFRDNLPEGIYQQWQVDVLNEAYRTVKPGGSLFYNHKIRWNDGEIIHPYSWLCRTVWKVKQEIIWDRKLAANIRGWRFWQTDERIYWLYKPFKGKHGNIGVELKSRHASLRSIWQITPEKKNRNSHPAPFPLALAARIIYSIFDEKKGKHVLDMFCGSGTTLLAAKLLGHHYIGIDNSPEYVKMARRRLEQPPEHDIERFQQEIALHKTNTSYDEFRSAKKSTGRYKSKYRQRRQSS